MMFVPGLCSALLLCIGLASVLGQDSGDMPFNETLDSAGNVSLRWGFDSKQETITFQLACKTRGWVGFGLSPSGEMDGSDIVIGGVNPDGTTYFTDRHAVGDQLPLVDGSQDYTLLSLKEDATGTTMKFSRKVQTCDKDDMEISTSAMKLIYAYGADDSIAYHNNARGTKSVNLLQSTQRSTPSQDTVGQLEITVNSTSAMKLIYAYGTDDSIAYHNNARGTKSVNLLQSTQRSTPSQDTVGQLEITVNSFAVPERDTYYHCRIIKSPDFPGKRHVYRIEPKIQSGNVDLVHHMLVYACPASVSVELEGECYSGQSMYVFSSCQQVVIGWAVGGQDIWMPPNAGISIGTSDDPVFYRLEMHYSNSKLSKGRVDSSGLVFHYTSELRANDVGILEMGLIVDTSYVIPPNAKDFKTYGLCNTSTFSQGDEILVECTYNTESRKTATQGGLGTTNEMCLAFLLYYPRTKLASCWSLPEPTAMSAALGVKGTSELVALMNSSIWNDTAVGRFERTVRGLPQLMAVSVSNTALAMETDSYESDQVYENVDIKQPPSRRAGAQQRAPDEALDKGQGNPAVKADGGTAMCCQADREKASCRRDLCGRGMIFLHSSLETCSVSLGLCSSTVVTNCISDRLPAGTGSEVSAAEGECLLVSLPPPSPTPAREGDKHQSPASEAELHQSPAKVGDYTLLPPPSSGDHTLLPPPPLPPLGAQEQELPLLPPPPSLPPLGAEQQELPLPPPPPPAEGEYLLVPPPLQWEDCLPLPPPPAEGEYLLVPPSPLWEDCWPLPPPPAEGEYLLVPPSLLWEDCLPLPPPPAEDEYLLVPPPPGAEEQGLPLLPVPPPEGVRWPEPQKGELPVTKKGEEVWRPLSPAALSLQELLWPEPHKGELPATKKGEVGGPPDPAAFSLQDWTSMLSVVPLPAGELTALPAMGPVKPPFPARDFVLDCWIFKGGGGR
ncbi:UNVERIFIED_CONTAM: hypothetical protein FKN15_070589 [Acipenser sinensis]